MIKNGFVDEDSFQKMMNEPYVLKEMEMALKILQVDGIME